MYSPSFEYYRARSADEALQLLAGNPGAKLLAGGHSLVPLLKLRLAAPSAVVDIGRIPELRGMSRQGDEVRIGALTTHAELAASADLRRDAPALAAAAAVVGDPAVRSRGTIGGNVAHADPASDLPTVLIALDARIIAAGAKGERTIPAEQFFTGIMTTALAEDEIVLAIQVPVASREQGSAYEKFAHPASRYAVIGVAACVTVRNGSCTAARVAIGGLLPYPRRAPAVEAALIGKAAWPRRVPERRAAGSEERTTDSGNVDDAIAEAARQISADLGADVMGDIYASAEYRAAMAPVFTERAVAAAVARAAER
jgi:aerobic carbon-monoxide dehydrogenase medium subunit